MSRGRAALAAALVLAALAVALAGVLRAGNGGAGDSRPETLVDGSSARPAPAVLGLGDEAVLARVREVRHDAARADLRSCLGLLGVDEPAAGAVVEVVGLAGRSLTLRVDAGRTLAACEASTHAREERDGPWCGTSAARLLEGRLRDARVNIANCLDAERRTLAFAWIEPAPGTRWLAARGNEATEVYPVVPDTPLRVTSTDVDHAAAAAVFDVTHFDRDGEEIRADSVVVRVAG